MEVKDVTKVREFQLTLSEDEMKDLAQILWASNHENSADLFCALPSDFTSGDHIEGEAGGPS